MITFHGVSHAHLEVVSAEEQLAAIKGSSANSAHLHLLGYFKKLSYAHSGSLTYIHPALTFSPVWCLSMTILFKVPVFDNCDQTTAVTSSKVFVSQTDMSECVYLYRFGQVPPL